MSGTSSIEIMLKHCSKSSLSINNIVDKSLNDSNKSVNESFLMSSPPPKSPMKRFDEDKMLKVWIDGSASGSYRTVRVTDITTARDVINRLGSRIKVKCADPKLHQLHMQV